MKLAEALIERAEMQKVIAALESRMMQNVKIQEGDEAAEDVGELMKQYEEVMGELEKLIIRINETNFQSGLSQMLAHRDRLKNHIGIMRKLCDECSISQGNRFSRNEVKFVRCIDVADFQRRIDVLSKEYRTLDTQIQAKNWSIEII